MFDPKKDALIVVDPQNDFMPGGNLSVKYGDTIVPLVNSLMHTFHDRGSKVIITQDWHPEGHSSFIPQGGIWPEHCVQGSAGAQFHPALHSLIADKIIQKGENPAIDSYSGFFDNDGTSETGLNDYLQDHEIERVFICGLALDYCVLYTAKDAYEYGYETFVIKDATKSVCIDWATYVEAMQVLHSTCFQIHSSEVAFIGTPEFGEVFENMKALRSAIDYFRLLNSDAIKEVEPFLPQEVKDQAEKTEEN